jgi:hypothetical protein
VRVPRNRRDDLQGADLDQSARVFGQGVPGAQPLGDRTIEVMRIDRELDAMRVEAPATRRAHASAFQAMSKSTIPTIPRAARRAAATAASATAVRGVQPTGDLEGVLLAQDAVEGRREALARNAAELSQTLCTSALMR